MKLKLRNIESGLRITKILENLTNLRNLQSKFQYILCGCLFAISVSFPVYAGVPLPHISKGKGDRCVEDTEYMRKNHMKLLFHQRDETVHLGIRTKKHSLKECINCHAVKGEDNQPVSIASPKHFCNSCHGYAAVTIDCFECHASKPDNESIGRSE